MSVNEVKSVKYNLIGDGLPFGCKIKSGKIVPAFSAGEVNSTCPSGVSFAAFVRNIKRFFLMSLGFSFSAVEGASFTTLSYTGAALPFAIEHKSDSLNAAKFIFDNNYVYYRGTGRYTFDCPQSVGGGVYKNGRVFAVDLSDRCKLRWSGEGGFEDWEEKIDGAGWLYPDVELGEIYRLYVLKGLVAAFRQYGVSLISAYGTPQEFKEVASIATPPTYKECATVCGNKLYFYTVDGMYALNASGAEKVNIRLAEDFTSAVYAMTYGDCVFFAGTHKKLGKDVILVYDTKEKSAYFIDLAATALCAGSYPYAFTQRGAVKLTKGNSFTYESVEIGDFSKRAKVLKSLVVGSQKEVDITVITDRETRLFKGVKGAINTQMCGSFFKVSVQGADTEINELTATVEFY